MKIKFSHKWDETSFKEMNLNKCLKKSTPTSTNYNPKTTMNPLGIYKTSKSKEKSQKKSDNTKNKILCEIMIK